MRKVQKAAVVMAVGVDSWNKEAVKVLLVHK